MKLITVWERYNGQVWKHNHISNNYDPTSQFPISNDKEQTKGWKKGIWKATKAYLNQSNTVVE